MQMLITANMSPHHTATTPAAVTLRTRPSPCILGLGLIGQPAAALPPSILASRCIIAQPAHSPFKHGRWTWKRRVEPSYIKRCRFVGVMRCQTSPTEGHFSYLRRAKSTRGKPNEPNETNTCSKVCTLPKRTVPSRARGPIWELSQPLAFVPS
jgi:hypothetical protein